MKNFLKQNLWTIRIDSKPTAVRNGLHILRVIMLTGKMYLKNFCALRASALTFFTLLSIIPVLALGFAIAKGFGLDEKLETWLFSVFKDYPLIAEKLVEFSSNTLNGAKGGVIAGVGSIVLLYTTIKLLMQIEEAFNGIWGVHASRSWLRKISDYLSLVLLCPILIAINGSMSAFANAQIAGIQQILPFLQGDFSVLMSKLLSFSATWILFVFIYIFIPNTRVRLIPAACGGFIAAFLYYLIQSVYIAAQFLAAKYNAIYGGFAALPLFLIWLQISWTIVLFGSEIVFAIQNVRIYEGLPLDNSELGEQRKILYALRIMRYCVSHFHYGNDAPTEEEIATDLEIPLLGARSVLSDLVQAKLLFCIRSSDRSAAYQVALPPDKITPVFILEALLKRHEETIPEIDQKASELLDGFLRNPSDAKLNVPISEVEI